MKIWSNVCFCKPERLASSFFGYENFCERSEAKTARRAPECSRRTLECACSAPKCSHRAPVYARRAKVVVML